MYTFRLSQSTDLKDVHEVTSFACPPTYLVGLLGPPSEGDNYQTSGRYVFEGDNGTVFTVYDLKATTLYWGDASGYLTPTQFWSSKEPQEFHVGSNNRVQSFKFLDWLYTSWMDQLQPGLMDEVERSNTAELESRLTVYLKTLPDR